MIRSYRKIYKITMIYRNAKEHERKIHLWEEN